MNDIFDTTKKAKGTFYSTEDPLSVEGQFRESRFHDWEYEIMRGEVEDLKKEVSELRKFASLGDINEVTDKKAETMIAAFILEQKGVGRKSIKGPEIAGSLCLPADQVERVLDRFVEKKKLSLV